MRTTFKLQYYLDTCAVQALGIILEKIPLDKGVFTSIYTIEELIKKINDDESYHKIKGPLTYIRHAIPIIAKDPITLRLEAFNVFDPQIETFEFVDKIWLAIVESENYDTFITSLINNDLMHAFQQLKKFFNEGQNIFRDSLKRYNEPGDLNANKTAFETKWKGDRIRLLDFSICYYAQKIADNNNLPFESVINNYNHSIDYFMLITYYYDDKKNYCRELAAKNDGHDLMHTIYLNRNALLVTDDNHFKENVNEVFPRLAIGTKDFLKEIDYF